MGGKSSGKKAAAAADESNNLLEEQNRLARQQEKLKLSALQREEFDIVSDQTGGNFSAKAPTQADYPGIPDDNQGGGGGGSMVDKIKEWEKAHGGRFPW